MPTIKLVLLRHGESVWNRENRFTGWTDVDLSEQGRQEAVRAGRLLKQAGFAFDVCHASVLKRAIRTAWTVLDELDQMWIPVNKTWRLNERHYGALQGLDKAETAAKHGDQQVLIWRRSYDVPPPELESSDPRHPRHDPRYAAVPAGQLPGGEALSHTVARVVPAWTETIAPDLRAGKRVLIAAHGNSIRAMIKYLEDTPNQELLELNVPTAVPLVYELTQDLRPVNRFYLGDPAEVAKSLQAVADQGKAKK